jgi:hypothetical protein
MARLVQVTARGQQVRHSLPGFSRESLGGGQIVRYDLE